MERAERNAAPVPAPSIPCVDEVPHVVLTYAPSPRTMESNLSEHGITTWRSGPLACTRASANPRGSHACAILESPCLDVRRHARCGRRGMTLYTTDLDGAMANTAGNLRNGCPATRLASRFRKDCLSTLCPPAGADSPSPHLVRVRCTCGEAQASGPHHGGVV